MHARDLIELFEQLPEDEQAIVYAMIARRWLTSPPVAAAPEPDVVLNFAEAAAVRRVSLKTLRKLIDEGAVVPLPGTPLRFSKWALLAGGDSGRKAPRKAV